MRETRGTETRTLPCVLTDDELLARGDALARQHAAIKDEEAAQAGEKKRMKEALDELTGEQARLARIVRDKAEPRDVECRIVHDYATQAVQVVRTDTGEVIESRAMTDRERQIGLPMNAVQ